MIKLLKTIVSAGKPAAKYPFAPYEVSPDFRGKPEYKPEQCIACAACTKVCPANALVMETDLQNGERRWEISMARCIFCGRCEEICPTQAITLSPNFEMAVTNKADLYEEARFELAACSCCGEYFAPAKLVQLVADTLQHAETPLLELSRLRLCPACKRKQSLISSSPLQLDSGAQGENQR